MGELVSAPFTAYIGARWQEKREGYGKLVMETGPQHSDALGNVHAGAIASLMDTVIGASLSESRGDAARKERPHATIAMSTSYYAQAPVGETIIAEGTVNYDGGLLAYGEVEARRSSDNLLIARAHLTFAIPEARG
jgi:acyl-coenzyme A thioesterase PaaI-like protein